MTAVVRVQRADVLDHTRVAEGAIDDPARLVVIHARDRTNRARGQAAVRRNRILANFFEIASLELAFEHDPVLPSLLE